MGYTHSTFRPEQLDRQCFERFAADVRNIIEYAKTDAPRVEVCGGDGTGRPTVTGEIVEFNGSDEHGEKCESYLVTRTPRPDLGQRVREGRIFSFCKTHGLPYDRVVVAANFSLAYHCAAVKFHSDGARADLKPGLDLFLKACEPDLRGRDLLAEAVTRDSQERK